MGEIFDSIFTINSILPTSNKMLYSFLQMYYNVLQANGSWIYGQHVGTKILYYHSFCLTLKQTQQQIELLFIILCFTQILFIFNLIFLS